MTAPSSPSRLALALATAASLASAPLLASPAPEERSSSPTPAAPAKPAPTTVASPKATAAKPASAKPAMKKPPVKKTTVKKPAPMGTTPAAASAPAAPIYDPYTAASIAMKEMAEISVASGRPMLVNFGTNDCAPCRVVNDALHEGSFFEEVTKHLVPVSIDVTPGSENEKVLRAYGADPAKGLPVVAVWDLAANTRAPVLVTRDGEMVAVAKKGPEAVRSWIAARFPPEPEPKKESTPPAP